MNIRMLRKELLKRLIDSFFSQKNLEFFGFFSFIIKAVALVGPLIFFIISSMLDNRSALLSIVFVIFIGTFLCALVDME